MQLLRGKPADPRPATPVPPGLGTLVPVGHRRAITADYLVHHDTPSAARSNRTHPYTPPATGANIRPGWRKTPCCSRRPEPPKRLAWAACRDEWHARSEGAPVQQCTGATRRRCPRCDAGGIRSRLSTRRTVEAPTRIPRAKQFTLDLPVAPAPGSPAPSARSAPRAQRGPRPAATGGAPPGRIRASRVKDQFKPRGRVMEPTGSRVSPAADGPLPLWPPHPTHLRRRVQGR